MEFLVDAVMRRMGKGTGIPFAVRFAGGGEYSYASENGRGGLGTVIPIAQNETAQAINQQNNYRSGSLNTYGLAQRVEPTQVSYSNPIADVAQQFLGAGMAGLGKTFAGAITPGATAAAQALPAVGPIPPPRPLF